MIKIIRTVVVSGICASLLMVSACTKKSDSPSVMTPDSNGTLSGKISLAPLLSRQPIKPDSAMFLIARRAGETEGPPVAVKRFVPPYNFPIDFTLSKADSMIANMPFTGPFTLTVRIAQSGSATPAQTGDLEGEVAAGSVQAGQKDIEVRISKVRP
jgi:hypothetical protein